MVAEIPQDGKYRPHLFQEVYFPYHLVDILDVLFLTFFEKIDWRDLYVFPLLHQNYLSHRVVVVFKDIEGFYQFLGLVIVQVVGSLLLIPGDYRFNVEGFVEGWDVLDGFLKIICNVL